MFDSRSRLLVTGATGFLGGAIIADLVTRSLWPQVRLLVRAPSKAAGAERIRATLAQFEVPAEQIARVSAEQIILGDLGTPDAICTDAALATITHVINSAALATFSTNPQLWPINVEGTFTFARRLSEVARLDRKSVV